MIYCYLSDDFVVLNGIVGVMIYLVDFSGFVGVVNKIDFIFCEYVFDVSVFRVIFNFCFMLFLIFFISEIIVFSFLGFFFVLICFWLLEFCLCLKKFIVFVKKIKIFFGFRFLKWYIN